MDAELDLYLKRQLETTLMKLPASMKSVRGDAKRFLIQNQIPQSHRVDYNISVMEYAGVKENKVFLMTSAEIRLYNEECDRGK